MKILFFDIEVSPTEALVWEMYDTNVAKIVQPWHMLSFAYKWKGEKKVHCKSLPDYKGYNKDKRDDTELVKDLHQLFQEADIIIGHNGDRFDIKKANARFIQLGLTPPPPYKTIDTLKVARRHFKFDSNRLDALARFFNLGRKLPHQGIDMWHDCLGGDKKAWSQMVRYNKHDVVLLEKLYNVLLPWISNHPNINVTTDEDPKCPKCGSTHLQRRGWAFTNSGLSKYRRFQCQDCDGWSKGQSIRTEIEIR